MEANSQPVTNMVYETRPKFTEDSCIEGDTSSYILEEDTSRASSGVAVDAEQKWLIVGMLALGETMLEMMNIARPYKMVRGQEFLQNALETYHLRRN